MNSELETILKGVSITAAHIHTLIAVPFQLKVEKKLISDEKQLKEVRQREEEYYEKWQSTEMYEKEKLLLMQEKHEFQRKWMRAEKILKQKEVEIEEVP